VKLPDSSEWLLS